MDDCPSNFHYFEQTDHHHNNDPLQLYSSTDPCQDDNSFELQENAFLVDDVTDKSACKGRGKASTGCADHDQNPGSSDPKKRKILHKDIERQRRQEMATLYRELRSLLPLHYLKGNRSICDHMHEAVNYIKHLQNKMQELNKRRDELRRLSNSSTGTSSCASECPPSSHPENIVTVRPCLAGVEVVVSTVSLSRVMQALIGEGLNILNCISTRINGRLLHTLECQVSGGRSIDLFELQQKLIPS